MTNESSNAPDSPHDVLDDVCASLESSIDAVFQVLESWSNSNSDDNNVISQPALQLLRQRFQQLRMRKEAWEAYQHERLRDVEDQAARLTEAWLALESEQIAFLQSKEATSAVTPNRASGVPSVDSTSAPSPPPTERVRHAGPPPISTGGNASSVRQFELLKQQVTSPQQRSRS